MKKLACITACFALALTSFNGQAQISIGPLTTFGGDGWLANGESSYLANDNLARGLAYGNGHLYLASRTGGNNVRVLNPLTGADLGGLDLTGVSGGAFAINMISVGGDGHIYVGNLTTQASTSPFKVYRWVSEASIPTTVYSGAPIEGGRVGDTLDAIGSGSLTRLVVGFGSTPATNGNNGYAIIDPTTGTHTQVAFAGTPPNAGDFRLGITFTDADHVFGTQGGINLRYTSYSGSVGTLLGAGVVTTSSQRLMDYTVLGGIPLLAVMDTVDSGLRLYDATDPLNLVYINTATTLTGTPNANGNGTGAVAWGDSYYDSSGWNAHLYALNSNNGIQAFIVTVPEPSAYVLFALGGFGLLVWRWRRLQH